MNSEATIRRFAGSLLLVWSLIIWPSALPAQQWEHLTPRERYDTMQGYRQYENLPPERKEDIDKRYERWRNLPDSKREQVLRNYQRYQQMPPAERQQFDQKYDRWRQQDPRPEGEPRAGKPHKAERNHDRQERKRRKEH